jgi:hypothetical protein
MIFKDFKDFFDLEVLFFTRHNEIVWLYNSGMIWITGKT